MIKLLFYFLYSCNHHLYLKNEKVVCYKKSSHNALVHWLCIKPFFERATNRVLSPF